LQESFTKVLTKSGDFSLIRTVGSGQIAQLVEQGIENPRVGGSIPSLATTLLGYRQVVRHRFLVSAFPGSNPGTPAIANKISC
jgi:hypothetical protein